MDNKKENRRICGIPRLMCMAAALVLFGCLLFYGPGNIVTSVYMTQENKLLIDPGHGGFDGGAESSDGVPEKNINLAISMKIKELAEKDGWNVMMTRDEDKGLEGDVRGAIRSKKTADISARRELIREFQPALTVSIHLNSFKEDKNVRGAQVFYPKHDETSEEVTAQSNSKIIAEAIQEALIRELEDGTNRKAMSKDGIGIMRDAPCPVVLVECGFLSNPEEALLLQSDKYQMKIAEAVYSGIANSMGKGHKNIERMGIIDSACR